MLKCEMTINHYILTYQQKKYFEDLCIKHTILPNNTKYYIIRKETIIYYIKSRDSVRYNKETDTRFLVKEFVVYDNELNFVTIFSSRSFEVMANFYSEQSFIYEQLKNNNDKI